jgi:hypothetical protein
MTSNTSRIEHLEIASSMEGSDIAQMVLGNSRLDHGKLASVFDTPRLPLRSLHVNSLQIGFVSTSTSLFEVSDDQVVLDKTLTSAKLRRAWRENWSLQHTGDSQERSINET